MTNPIQSADDSRMSAIKATVFLDKLRFYAIRAVLFAFSCRPEQEQETKKERAQAGERRAEKVLRTTAPEPLRFFPLTFETKQEDECAPSFLPLKLCRRLKEDRPFVSLI